MDITNNPINKLVASVHTLPPLTLKRLSSLSDREHVHRLSALNLDTTITLSTLVQMKIAWMRAL
jgi:hypothetical protein